jgi:hypothetical protein
MISCTAHSSQLTTGVRISHLSVNHMPDLVSRLSTVKRKCAYPYTQRGSLCQYFEHSTYGVKSLDRPYIEVVDMYVL